MHSVGLTGNIASGKSTVAREWARLGAPLVDADVLARRAVAPGTPALAEIRARWGEKALDEEGRLDRAALREIVFRDPDARRDLEGIVHPRVAELRDAEYRRLQQEGAKVVVADVPLLFEVGMEDEFDTIVLVDAPAEVRMERLVRDRGMDREEAMRMVAAQMPAPAKRERADRVIENAGTVQELKNEAANVWRWILDRAGIAADERGEDGTS